MEILSYLSWNHLQSARLVCRQWYELSHQLISLKCGIKVKRLKEIGADDVQDWLKTKKIGFHTVSLTRQFFNVKMPDSEFEKILNVFQPTTKRIFLASRYLTDQQFKVVVERCPDLECLGVMRHTIGDTFTESKHVEDLVHLKPMTKVKEFHFQSGCNGFREDNVFELLTKAMPNVEIVRIQLNMFDIKNEEELLPECEQVVHKFIEKQATILKVFTFFGWRLKTLLDFMAIPGTKFQELDLDCSATSSGLDKDLDSSQKLIDLVEKQFNLTQLRLNNLHLDTKILEQISSNLLKLKIFEMDSCHLTSVEELTHFDKLQVRFET